MSYVSKVSCGLRTPLFACAVLTAVVPLSAASQVLSNDDLYVQGKEFYDRREWIAAVEYLWALIQRDPSEFATNPALYRMVQDALLESEERLQEAIGKAARWDRAASSGGLRVARPGAGS